MNKSKLARDLGVTRNKVRWELEKKDAVRALKAELKSTRAQVTQLSAALDRARAKSKRIKVRQAKPGKSFVRVCIPDSHGEHVDWTAAEAMVADIAVLSPAEVVWLGDHLDCGGTFSAHQRTYTKELTESYASDVAAANRLLDLVQEAAPNARHHYIAGNHETHVERWAVRNVAQNDVAHFLERIGPAAELRLKERGFEYYRSSEFYHDLSIPGTIRLGKCCYTHGIGASKHATAVHAERFGMSVVHGHTHRAQSIIMRTVGSSAVGAWCPGTLAKLQPLYAHTRPTDWSHGYLVQFVSAATGRFTSLNIPIFSGKTMLADLVSAVRTG